MRRALAAATAFLLLVALAQPPANAYLTDTTIPQGGGCPQMDRWNLSLASPLNRRWSTSLPGTILTAAPAGSAAQLTEIGQAVSGKSYPAWAIKKGNTELVAYMNEFIAKEKANGTMPTLQKKWFGESFPDLPVTFTPEF